MKKFNGCHIVYLLLSIVLIAAGILLFPGLTGLCWGEKVLDLLIGLILLFYFILVIIPALDKFSDKHIESKVLILIETIAIAFLMVASFLSFFEVMSALPVHIIVGGALWLRGTILVVQAIHGKRSKFNWVGKYIYILLISLGVWVIFGGVVTEKNILIAICCLFFALALMLLVFAIQYWPKKTKEEKERIRKEKEAKRLAKEKKKEEARKAKEKADAEKAKKQEAAKKEKEAKEAAKLAKQKEKEASKK